MTDILMPKLSDSMEQGTIISWFKATGDQVEAGDELLGIETDKSTAPYVAEVAGALEIVAPVGTTVLVGELIARIGSAVPAANAADLQPAPPATPDAGDRRSQRRGSPSSRRRQNRSPRSNSHELRSERRSKRRD